MFIWHYQYRWVLLVYQFMMHRTMNLAKYTCSTKLWTQKYYQKYYPELGPWLPLYRTFWNCLTRTLGSGYVLLTFSVLYRFIRPPNAGPSYAIFQNIFLCSFEDDCRDSRGMTVKQLSTRQLPMGAGHCQWGGITNRHTPGWKDGRKES